MIKIFYVVDKESENEKTRKKWNVKWTRRGHVMRSRMARTSIKKSESEKWKEQESGATKCALIDCFNNFTLEWCKQKAKTLTILYIGPISFRPLRHPWIFFTHKKKNLTSWGWKWVSPQQNHPIPSYPFHQPHPKW